eukprot:CAMPEP_0115168580 /NCGR_PEP_ID=MMETSP0270-20121206/825_1 /TAXON_ID=71861 /ORGANISM="Scrippsiella trochoidea, Strain CCMP3099" /LENGTH=184 /DNA_ID=CAMNT_0002581249 /DNA_START=246 /DNA_END=801 /DNA_ORIENTATION=-
MDGAKTYESSRMLFPVTGVLHHAHSKSPIKPEHRDDEQLKGLNCDAGRFCTLTSSIASSSGWQLVVQSGQRPGTASSTMCPRKSPATSVQIAATNKTGQEPAQATSTVQVRQTPTVTPAFVTWYVSSRPEGVKKPAYINAEPHTSSTLSAATEMGEQILQINLKCIATAPVISDVVPVTRTTSK